MPPVANRNQRITFAGGMLEVPAWSLGKRRCTKLIRISRLIGRFWKSKKRFGVRSNTDFPRIARITHGLPTDCTDHTRIAHGLHGLHTDCPRTARIAHGFGGQEISMEV